MKTNRDHRSVQHLLQLLVASGRPAVEIFFRQLRGVTLTAVGLAMPELEAALVGDPELSLAVVDVAVEPVAGIALCRQIRVRRPQLPITALLCCPQAVDPWQLQALFTSGVTSVIDLQVQPDEALRALTAAADGAAVLHLHLRRAHHSVLKDLFVDQGPRTRTKLQLLELICRGLPDHEIGRRLHLSPHTVKHQIENIRAELGVGNRMELAAWAGRHGFYSRDRDGAGELVPVEISHPRRRQPDPATLPNPISAARKAETE